ncbi:hypothetical protein FRC09_014651 [Ceratobasidium sp. 395]|nr:hypothetical protein FRC09_014651 [Ceratobasidium sp. 395]
MDNTDWVERYAWFGAMANTPINKDTVLMDKSGKINNLGKQYTGAQAPIIHGGALQPQASFVMLLVPLISLLCLL